MEPCRAVRILTYTLLTKLLCLHTRLRFKTGPTLIFLLLCSWESSLVTLDTSGRLVSKSSTWFLYFPGFIACCDLTDTGTSTTSLARTFCHRLVENLLPVSTKRPRSPNGLYKTPPYVTARPEVTHRKISVGNGSMQGNLDGELRFLVMGEFFPSEVVVRFMVLLFSSDKDNG